MAAKKKPMADIAAMAAGADEMPDDEVSGLDLDAAMGEMPDEGMPGDDYDLDSDVFASEMAVAFPELAESPERLEAFKAAIEACVKANRGGE